MPAACVAAGGAGGFQDAGRRQTQFPTRLRARWLQGGNDNEIFESPDTVGHTVTGPDDTIRQLRELFPSA